MPITGPHRGVLFPDLFVAPLLVVVVAAVVVALVKAAVVVALVKAAVVVALVVEAGHLDEVAVGQALHCHPPVGEGSSAAT